MWQTILSRWCESNWGRRLGVCPSRRRRGMSPTERLEDRTLLATLVAANKVTYQDSNGDNVTVTFSKSFLTPANVNSIFTFYFQTVDGSNAAPTHLREINLTGIAAAAGTTIKTAAVRSATTGGDGFATLGQIVAPGLDLGAVTVDGDLGRIVAGDVTTTTQGLGALTVHSMGRYGTLTGAVDLTTVVQGKLASLTTKTDVKDAFIDVQGGINGNIGTITIGGSLLGGGMTNSGRIQSSGDIGAVIVTGDVTGAGGGLSGAIVSGGKLTSVTIGGSLIGGSGQASGQVFSTSTMGPVVVTGDIRGGSFAAANETEGAGAVVSIASIANVTIGGSQIGGSGFHSGLLASGLGSGPLKDMGAVKITGDVRGGTGPNSGSIQSAGKLASVTIGGSLIGGEAGSSGCIHSALDMGAVIIKGDVKGGTTSYTAYIDSSGKLASVSIGGSLIGGAGSNTGFIRSVGELTTLSITGNIHGGLDGAGIYPVYSGSVKAGRIGTLTLGGSLIAGAGAGSGTFLNGAILADDDIGSITIKGSLIGNATYGVTIAARGQVTPAGSTDMAIGKLTVNGRVEYAKIRAGVTVFHDGGNPFLQSKNADAQIGPVVVGRDWIASSLVAGATSGADGFYGNSNDAKMAGASVKDLATVFSKITSIVIGGQIIGTTSLNTDHFGFVAENIGSFKVKGGANTFPMVSGNGNDDFNVTLGFLGAGADVRVNEI